LIVFGYDDLLALDGGINQVVQVVLRFLNVYLVHISHNLSRREYHD